MNELQKAEAIAAGAVRGPIQHYASWFLALRITAVGVAFRDTHDEFVLREQRIWLADAMKQRCTGLPVVVTHPVNGILDAVSFRETVVGITVLTFTRDAELWAVARIFDETIVKAITSGEFAADTSPSALFEPGETSTIELDDGRTLLIEGEPASVDHVAIVPVGVWSRNGKPGIDKNPAEEMKDA